MLEIPVRRLPYPAGCGVALTLDDADVDDAGCIDRLDNWSIDGPRIDLDGVRKPAVAGGKGGG